MEVTFDIPSFIFGEAFLSFIGLGVQAPMTYLNPTMNIGEQIAESLIIHNKISKREALEQAFELLKAVKISNPEIRIKQIST